MNALQISGMNDVSLKARFREIARRILSDAREARQWGSSHDTSGAIQRALMAAYKEGQQAGPGPAKRTPTSPPGLDFMVWEEIVPTARKILWLLTLSYSARPGRAPTYEPDELIAYTHMGRDRWLPSRYEAKPENLWSDKGVLPLVRAGLLEVSPDDEGRLRLTAKGDRTARHYWKRSDADDPTLPVG